MSTEMEILSEAQLCAAEEDAMRLFDKFFDLSDEDLDVYEIQCQLKRSAIKFNEKSYGLMRSQTTWEWFSSGITSFGKNVAQTLTFSPNEDGGQASENGEKEIATLSNEKVDELVIRLKHLGDKINKDLEMKQLDMDLQDFIAKTGSSLTYEDFSSHMDEMCSERRTIDDLLLMMHLSKRVVKGLQSGASLAKMYLKQYIASEFKETIALEARG